MGQTLLKQPVCATKRPHCVFSYKCKNLRCQFCLLLDKGGRITTSHTGRVYQGIKDVTCRKFMASRAPDVPNNMCDKQVTLCIKGLVKCKVSMLIDFSKCMGNIHVHLEDLHFSLLPRLHDSYLILLWLIWGQSEVLSLVKPQ